MSSTESFDDLEQKFSGLLEDALREIREEFEQRLQSARERLEERVGAEMGAARQESEEAATRLADAEAASAEMEQRRLEELAAAEEAKIAALAEAEEAKATALAEAEEAKQAALVEAAARTEAAVEQGTRDLLHRLHRAASAIDLAGSQAEILDAMLQAGTDFAWRTGLLLTREDGLRGWSSHNFQLSREDFRQVHLDYAEGSAWSRLAEGRGTVELDAGDCGALCDPIDQGRPDGGVLIPLVLGDRLAAAVYADQVGDATPLQVPALQLLTYLTAQALETLPLRRRQSTATLRMASEAAADEPPLDLWDFVAPAPPTEERVSVPVESATGAIADSPEAEEAVGVESMRESWLAPEQAIEVEEPGWEAPIEVEPAALEPAEESGFAVEEIAAEVQPDEAMPAYFEQDQTISEEPVATEAGPIAEVEPVAESWQVSGLEIETAAERVPAEEEVPPRADLGTAEEPPAGMPAETMAVEAAAELAPPTEVAPPAAAATQGAEVTPPEDVEGPGWAFTTRAISSEEGLSAEHEEARRLARLLVTEIKLYNEEQVEEGRRDRNVYQSLREDIDRSRQIYEDRIDPSVRESSDYFYEELVRILAAGDAEILGV